MTLIIVIFISISLLLYFTNQTKKSQSHLQMEHFPPELLSNILTRLPSTELSNMKLVSKSWFNLITDSHFISNYYVVHNNNQEKLLVIRRPFLSGLKTYISINSVVDVNINVTSEVLTPPFEYNSDHKYCTEIMGPCNGIYFLEGNRNVIMNPSLRQFVVLPQSHFTPPNGTYSFIEYAGFGFDPKTNDYKVVVLKELWWRETDERKNGSWFVELYSLNSNSWRKLDANDVALPLPFEILGSSRVYTFVKNSCHWLGNYVDDSGGSKVGDVVIAFDMVGELFRKIRVPKIGYDYESSGDECFKTLVPFNDSATIGVIVYPVRGLEKWFDVWVMGDYWNEESWIKQYSVGPVAVNYKLVGFYGNNRFLWRDSKERLVLYESECDDESIKDFQVYGKHDSIRAARYMESIVSLPRRNENSQQCFSFSLVVDPLLNQRE